MGKYYDITLERDSPADTLISVGFLAPAQNDVIVKEVVKTMSQLNLSGGRIVRFNGPASLPVAMALAHSVAHLYEVVACFDPKLHCYIVAVSHHPDVRPGDRLEC